MTSVLDKRRPLAVLLVFALLAAIALLVGAGRAEAGWPCNDQAPPQDTNVNVNNTTYVGVDVAPNLVAPAPGDYPHAWACVALTGGEANQSWVNVWLTPSGTPGYTADSEGCFVVALGCTTVLGPTGAYVANPTTTTNAPLSGPAGSGASAGTGTGTCAYANGTSNCPAGVTIAGITVNEADLVPSVTTHTPAPPCTGVNNTCLPVGGTVRVLNDTSRPTLSVTTGATGSTTNLDAAPTGVCVQVNAGC
jgi:hypothetical protein